MTEPSPETQIKRESRKLFGTKLSYALRTSTDLRSHPPKVSSDRQIKAKATMEGPFKTPETSLK